MSRYYSKIQISDNIKIKNHEVIHKTIDILMQELRYLDHLLDDVKKSNK